MAAIPELPAFATETRTGDCVSCGYPVALHFTQTNHKLTCAQLQAQLAALRASTPRPASAKREPLDISGWTLVGVAPSEKNPDVVYELRREPEGERRIGCTCTGWTMRWTCKHAARFIASHGAA